MSLKLLISQTLLDLLSLISLTDSVQVITLHLILLVSIFRCTAIRNRLKAFTTSDDGQVKGIQKVTTLQSRGKLFDF